LSRINASYATIVPTSITAFLHCVIGKKTLGWVGISLVLADAAELAPAQVSRTQPRRHFYVLRRQSTMGRRKKASHQYQPLSHQARPGVFNPSLSFLLIGRWFLSARHG
jgi:hypothetical protein